MPYSSTYICFLYISYQVNFSVVLLVIREPVDKLVTMHSCLLSIILSVKQGSLTLGFRHMGHLHKWQ